jgi:hypothetical protein
MAALYRIGGALSLFSRAFPFGGGSHKVQVMPE